jgi:hypothetical protein
LAEVEKYRIYLCFKNDREEAHQGGGYCLAIYKGTQNSTLSLSSKYHQNVWIF